MRRSRRDAGLLLVFLLLILALAAGLRFFNLGGQSLWSDEGNSVALAARSFAQITRDAANDIHPPLYYWLLRLWTQVFGVSEIALRSLSAVIGVLLVLAVAELGRLLFNEYVGLGGAFLAALSPFQVYYSQEARMYILVALEATVAIALLWWFVTREDLRLPTGSQPPQHMRLLPFSGQFLVLVWVAGLYTHYAFPLVIALSTGLYGIWLVVSRKRGRTVWRLGRWALLLAITAGLFAPWLPVAFRQLTAWPGVDASASLVEQVRAIVLTLVLGPAADAALADVAFALFVVAWLGALPWSLRDAVVRTGSTRVDGIRLLLPLALMLAPIAMILGLGLYREAYFKFLLIGSPALALLLARAALGPAEWLVRAGPAPEPVPPLGIVASGKVHATSNARVLRIIAAVAWPVVVFTATGAASGATLQRYYTDPAAARDDYRAIAHFIMATGQDDDAVLLAAPGQSEVFEYYYTGDLPVHPLPQQRPIDLEDTQARLTQLLDHDKIYAVFWALNEADPQGFIESWLNHRGYKTLDQWHGNVRLVVYQMPEHAPPDEAVDDLDAQFTNAGGERITLEAYQGWNLTPTAGEVTQAQLQWRADSTPSRRYKVFLQLLDARDQVIAQRDSEPAGDSRPTNGWQPGETVSDNHGLLIPPGTPPGSYRRIVGLYDAETMERLKLSDGSDYFSLTPIQVARAPVAPALQALNMQYTQQFDFGGISLLGYDAYKRGFSHEPATPLQPGSLLHLTFFWRANIEPRADWWFNLVLSNDAGEAVAQLQSPLVGPTYLTTLWQEGEVVRGEHDLQIPAELPPDTYRLSLTMLPDAETEAGSAYLGNVKLVSP